MWAVGGSAGKLGEDDDRPALGEVRQGVALAAAAA